ncbi:hypothetical protein RGU12_00615 [Fredinandcohnia sp. QZ13]|uniref:hypothetical protein n=1 Tax=Fredinandcohnia sp. QZ13 TaxID=3073144 RepID=UPI00285300B6|nr:hypothetical protein [Fredinandcohnia sp. QZ13]MDR4886045.1 hypothetical protein [Fredinandcohnia sp. QZ13]
MGVNPKDLQDSQQKLTNMLVKNILNKHGVQLSTPNVSRNQKQELRNTIRKLQEQTHQFLNNTQTTLTENDVNPDTGMVEDTNTNRPKVYKSVVTNKSTGQNRKLK